MTAIPLRTGLKRIAAAGLDLLLPPTCMACEFPTDGPFRLCGPCFGEWHFITDPMCTACGVPFAYAGQRGFGGQCPSCLARPPRFTRARAAVTYDARSKALLLPFKYADRTELARLFAPMMARAGASLLHDADVLIPVPLHRARLRARGYNQAALLAASLGRLAQRPVLRDGLRRIRPTAPLGEHDVDTRASIMAGAIVAHPERAATIAGKRIVLVDDVMTSGATLNACADALLAAGASRVDAVVAARVPDPDLDRPSGVDTGLN